MIRKIPPATAAANRTSTPIPMKMPTSTLVLAVEVLVDEMGGISN
jgi:hypothetical protein